MFTARAKRQHYDVSLLPTICMGEGKKVVDCTNVENDKFVDKYIGDFEVLGTSVDRDNYPIELLCITLLNNVKVPAWRIVQGTEQWNICQNFSLRVIYP